MGRVSVTRAGHLSGTAYLVPHEVLNVKKPCLVKVHEFVVTGEVVAPEYHKFSIRLY